MKKIHLGCGNKKIPGWQNFDTEVDFRQRLPFDDNSVDFIFSEHAIEHITQSEAIEFFKEAHRVLKVGGVMRIAFPDMSKVYYAGSPEFTASRAPYTEDKDKRRFAVRSMYECWEHKACWNDDLMRTILFAYGFSPKAFAYQMGDSFIPELQHLETNSTLTFAHTLHLETSIIEAVKV